MDCLMKSAHGQSDNFGQSCICPIVRSAQSDRTDRTTPYGLSVLSDDAAGRSGGLRMVPMPPIREGGGYAGRAVLLSLPTFWEKFRGVC